MLPTLLRHNFEPVKTYSNTERRAIMNLEKPHETTILKDGPDRLIFP